MSRSSSETRDFISPVSDSSLLQEKLQDPNLQMLYVTPFNNQEYVLEIDRPKDRLDIGGNHSKVVRFSLNDLLGDQLPDGQTFETVKNLIHSDDAVLVLGKRFETLLAKYDE